MSDENNPYPPGKPPAAPDPLRRLRLAREAYELVIPMLLGLSGLFLTFTNAFVWHDPAIWPAAGGLITGGGLLGAAVRRKVNGK